MIFFVDCISKESLDKLQDMVVTMLSDVENKNVKIKEWDEHPYGPDEVGVIGHIVPVKVRGISHGGRCFGRFG